MRVTDWLQFCPICREEDYRIFGEPYWRRLHQAPGVEVCIAHHVFLEKSGAPRTLPSSRYSLPTAKMHCQSVQARKLVSSDRIHQALLRSAQDVNWLLNCNSYHPDAGLLKRRYLELLCEKGLAKSPYQINHARLRDAIKSQLSDAVLRQWDSSLPNDRSHRWITNITRQKSEVVKHPLYHLALIHTLGFTAESFFTSLAEMPTKFGMGPWPCNNPTCSKDGQRIISSCQTIYSSNAQKLVGIFRCEECGHTYRGSGVIDSIDTPFIIGRCWDRGDLWRKRLAELWIDGSKTVRQIKTALHCSNAELVKQISSLGLPLQVNDRKGITVSMIKAVTARTQVHIKQVEKTRAIWLKLREENPNLGIKELQQIGGKTLYSRLYRNDRNWLLKNRPPARRRGRMVGDKYSLEDWERRDADYLERVRSAATKLRSQPGRPVLISKSAICRMISILPSSGTAAYKLSSVGDPLITRNPPVRISHLASSEMSRLLPKTSAVLSQVVESAGGFARRRLLWAAEEYRRNDVAFTKYQLLEKAGIRTLAEKDTHRPESVMLNALAAELCQRSCQQPTDAEGDLAHQLSSSLY